MGGRERLVAEHVLPGGERAPHVIDAQIGGGGVEKQRVPGVRQGGVEIRGPALDAEAPGHLLELDRVAADEDGVDREAVAVRQFDRRRAQGHQGAPQMLVEADAAGDPAQDDAQPTLCHDPLLARWSG